MNSRESHQTTPTLDRDFHELVTSLIDTLQEENRQNQRFLRVIRRKKELIGRGACNELDGIFRSEKEILADCVTVERDRVAILQALGECLGGDRPRRVRLAELMLYAMPEARDELLDLRDDFRDVADELDALAGVESRFERHVSGNMRLYLHDGDDAPRSLPRSDGGYGARCRPENKSMLEHNTDG